MSDNNGTGTIKSNGLTWTNIIALFGVIVMLAAGWNALSAQVATGQAGILARLASIETRLDRDERDHVVIKLEDEVERLTEERVNAARGAQPEPH
jgi:hypothetical protein